MFSSQARIGLEVDHYLCAIELLREHCWNGKRRDVSVSYSVWMFFASVSPFGQYLSISSFDGHYLLPQSYIEVV